jgi:hypothetical protein
MAFPKKYHIPHPWNVYYARARCQARHRREEWAFTPETWYRMWKNSGVMQYRMRQPQGYCMARMDKLEAWGPHNCVIVNRRNQLKKTLKYGPYPLQQDMNPFTVEDDVTPKDKQDRSFE